MGNNRDAFLAQLRRLLADRSYNNDRKKSRGELDLVREALELGREYGLPDAEIMALARNSIERVLDDALPTGRRARFSLRRRHPAATTAAPPTTRDSAPVSPASRAPELLP